MNSIKIKKKINRFLKDLLNDFDNYLDENYDKLNYKEYGYIPKNWTFNGQNLYYSYLSCFDNSVSLRDHILDKASKFKLPWCELWFVLLHMYQTNNKLIPKLKKRS